MFTSAGPTNSIDPIRRVLDQIEDALMHPIHGLDLWMILTALRGPDDESERLKAERTTWIRAHAFPRIARLAEESEFDGYWQGWAIGRLTTELDEFSPAQPHDAPHFLIHTQVARSILLAMEERLARQEKP